VTGAKHSEQTLDWGSRVYKRRTEMGLTQEQVSRLTGLSQQAISQIETGATVPRVTTLVSLARALGTSIDQLFPIGLATTPKRRAKKAKAS
jgi:putative transcriptional regulator